MREIRRSALVPQSPAQMYALVNAVADYPRFVPWCAAVRVHAEEPESLSATIEVRRAGLTVSITTENRMRPGESIELSLRDGPFRHFTGTGRFVPIRAAAEGDRPGELRGCRVELEVHFEFRNAALDLVAGPLFESTWGSLVDAFVSRAREVYGNAR